MEYNEKEFEIYEDKKYFTRHSGAVRVLYGDTVATLVMNTE